MVGIDFLWGWIFLVFGIGFGIEIDFGGCEMSIFGDVFWGFRFYLGFRKGWIYKGFFSFDVLGIMGVYSFDFCFLV